MRSSHRSRQRTVVCDYRCAHLFGLARWGYPLSQELEAVRHRVSACSEFRVASASYLFVFLKRVSESFGRPHTLLAVCFHLVGHRHPER